MASVFALGVTAIDTNVAAVVASCDDPETPPRVAVTVTTPTPVAVARPFWPAVLLTVAAAPVEGLQSTEAVRFWVVLSLYVPVAVNCSWVPLAMLGFTGVTAMEVNMAAVIWRLMEAETPPRDAVSAAVPTCCPSTTPCEPAALLTVTTAAFEEPHTTDAVRFWVVPSL